MLDCVAVRPMCSMCRSDVDSCSGPGFRRVLHRPTTQAPLTASQRSPDARLLPTDQTHLNMPGGCESRSTRHRQSPACEPTAQRCTTSARREESITVGGPDQLEVGGYYDMYRQNGCPAGSSNTRTPSCGWCSGNSAPSFIARATSASRSMTSKSRCIIICCLPVAVGHTGRT